MNINEDSILSAISIIKETVFDKDYSNTEKLIVLSNLLLDVSKDYFPQELTQDLDKILSNGKRVSFELNEYPDNVGLFIAYKAHLILSMVNEIDD